MMDIQVRFEDGSVELRDAETPCLDCHTPHDLTCGLAAAQHSEPLRRCRGLNVGVWRITSGRGENEPLTGEWKRCYVETVDEQIERLTRERDAALANESAAWIRGFATALAGACWGPGLTASDQMKGASLTVDDLRRAKVLEADIEGITLAMQRDN